jgi:hypothetical protein
LYIPGVALASASGSNSTFEAAALTDCAPQFGPDEQYDTGAQTDVAAHPSGLVVEFHKSHPTHTDQIWYKVGKFDGEKMTWGESKLMGETGYWPAVALSKEGYVIVVHADRGVKSSSQLYYHVGKIDPNGDHNQSITWLTDSIHWDRGFHSSIAINDSGVIVGVHETGHASTGLYYRVGRLTNPASADFTIQWDSGQWGRHYDEGINPHIAINNLNQVVQAHQVPGESLLHYRRGTVNGGTIQFGESRRYDNHAEQPAVALLDNGLVLEVHSLGGLIFRTGMLTPWDQEGILWEEPSKLSEDPDIEYPALAATGNYAVQTHWLGDIKDGHFAELRFSVANTPPCE